MRTAVLLISLAALALPARAAAQPAPIGSWHYVRSTLWTLGGEVWLDDIFWSIDNMDGLTAADRYEIWRVDSGRRPIELLFAAAPGEPDPGRVSLGTFQPGRQIWLGLLDTQSGAWRTASDTGAGYFVLGYTPSPVFARRMDMDYRLHGAILQPASVTPEPGAALLLGTGLVGLVAVGRRRRKQQQGEE